MQPPSTSMAHADFTERRDAAQRMIAASDFRRAIDLLEPCSRADVSGECLALLGDAYFLTARYSDAESAWRDAVSRKPLDTVLAAKVERAAVNVLANIASDEPQMLVFREGYTKDRLQHGPQPGGGAGAVHDRADAAGLGARLTAGVGDVAGAVLSAVGSAILHGLTEVAGRTGITDGVWTTWHTTGEGVPERLRPSLQILKLAFMRNSLFANNLVSPYPPGAKTAFCETANDPPAWALQWRTADGSWNDLRKDEDGRYDPMVGAAWTRLYRNVGNDRGLAATVPRAEPGTNPVNVRELSRLLLAPRGPRTEVPFLNLWAAAWIQFMIHDWVSHGSGDHTSIAKVPLPPNDPMRGFGVDALAIPATPPDLTRRLADGARPPTFLNEVTHWWDGSQLYGSDPKTQQSVRSGVRGKLTLTADGYLPIDSATGMEQTGFVRNWWVGLAMLHTLFAREHNAICDRLLTAYPAWDDERLFQTARLINAALMAKIHTVEWTPGILAHRTLHYAMRANWYGMLTHWFAGADPKTLEPIRLSSPLLGGIVGGAQATFARYGLSEEFTAVYRMHSLLPDSVRVEPAAGTAVEIPLLRTRNAAVKELLRTHGLAAFARGMGAQNCCALVANNYPRALLDISTPDIPLIDLGALDLFRDRERGIPPYNQLRAELGLPRIPDFDTLCDDAQTASLLRQAYGTDAEGHDKIDDMDLLIGTLCEGHRPEGFGFGETLLQIFVLNASWRLLGDRFYTDDYRPEIYTPEGIAWVDTTTFKDVLLRHFPELAATGLGNVRNAFEPWDEGRLDPARHPTRAFDKELEDDPWAGERAMAGP